MCEENRCVHGCNSAVQLSMSTPQTGPSEARAAVTRESSPAPSCECEGSGTSESANAGLIERSRAGRGGGELLSDVAAAGRAVKFAATLKGRAACARAKNIAEDVARE